MISFALQELPNHSIERMLQARENGESDEVIEKKVQRLEVEFEEQMALLWDMSAETDVMNFLVENKIFSFIRDTLDRSVCNRLTVRYDYEKYLCLPIMCSLNV